VKLTRTVRGAILVAALTLGLALGAVPLAAEGPDNVHLAVGPDSITYTPFYLADRLGFFKAEGLNVDFTVINSGATMVAPLGVGQLDVAGGAISAGLYNAVTRGIDIRIVADMGSDPPGYGFQTLVVRKSLFASGGFKSLKDLKGKRVAITAKGISTTALVAAALQKGGLTVNDVDLVYMGVADQITAMSTGAIDASFMPEPGPTIAQKKGIGVEVMRDDAFYPNQQLLVVLYGSSFMHERRAVGVRFMRAYLKAVRLYNDNLKGGRLSGPQAEQIMSIFADETHQDASVLSLITPPGNDPNGRLNLASMQRDYDFFKSQGLIEGAPSSPAAAVDGSFAADAVKTMGLYKH
jgi:NitT/TauT family transport system substrate-binding protein